MDGIFENLKKQAEETQARWDKIGNLSEELEKAIESYGPIENAPRLTARLILLLVKQFKPINVIDGKALEESVQSILDAFSGSNKKDGK